MSHSISPCTIASEHRPTLVVGLGASAGGLEALSSFFESLRCDTGCAFVVVQHLSPEHKSVMDELLSRCTFMDVTVASNDIRLCADTVYLMPRRKTITLHEGRLLLEEASADTLSFPIDLFFESLARDTGDRGIAVVLSGTGSDGSRGLRSVKEAGGRVLVQDLESAQFDGMPRSALSTDCVDVSHSPHDLAKYIAHCAQHPREPDSAQQGSVATHDNDEAIARIIHKLRAHSGIDFSYYKPEALAQRIERRLTIHQLNTLDEYTDLLEQSTTEIQSLWRELLNRGTQFFRNAEAFEFLKKQVIDEAIAALPEHEEYRVWVAGCSSGEEAYSIAILIDEAFRAAKRRPKARIFATDIDTSALAEASPGYFPSDIEHHVSKERLAQHFNAVDDGYVLHRSIRQQVVFATHNVFADPPFPKIDLVCCRNLLTHLQQKTQQVVINKFLFSLRSGGHVFLSNPQSVAGLDRHFDCLSEEHQVFVRPEKPETQRSAAHQLPLQMRLSPVKPVESILRAYRSDYRDRGLEQVRDSLLTEYLPPTIILNKHRQAVHIYGDAGRLLTRFPAGKVTNHIEDLLPSELSACISSGIEDVQQSHTSSRHTLTYVSDDDETLVVDVLVRKFIAVTDERTSLYLVVLRPVDAASHTTHNATIDSHPSDLISRQHLEGLEQQLATEQRQRRATAEQLEGVNEELQSANEELMSAVDELQNTNEELQSVNEELYTINNEYQDKIRELSAVHKDVDRIMEYTTLGLVFLDKQFRVKKFSKAATRFFRLLPSDIDRPLLYVANEFTDERLDENIASALKNGRPTVLQLRTQDRTAVDVQIIPDRTQSNDVSAEASGAILIVTESPAKAPMQTPAEALPA